MYLHIGAEAEDRLIGRCLDGDAAAFERLVERYHRALFRVAVRLLGDREDARDATQTAFLKAYQALATYDRRRRFFSWIYRILINDCLDTLRGKRWMEPLADLAAPPSRIDTVEAGETRRRVRRALLQLPSAQRDVIVLRHFAEMSYEQIAGVLGIPEKTVKSRLFDARRRLCELLAAERV